MNTQANSFFVLALNTDHDQSMLAQAQIQGAKEVIGHWKGEEEAAYVIDEGDNFGSVVSLALATGQEAFLHVSNGYGYLYEAPDYDQAVPVGLWQETSPEVAKRLDSYTKDPSTGKYWAIF